MTVEDNNANLSPSEKIQSRMQTRFFKIILKNRDNIHRSVIPAEDKFKSTKDSIAKIQIYKLLLKKNKGAIIFHNKNRILLYKILQIDKV